MQLFSNSFAKNSILSNLYTNKKATWIVDILETDIQPFVIQLALSMNYKLRVQVRWLDKYVFNLTPKMYLSLAWSIIPKTPKAPYVKYLKQQQNDDAYDFILDKVRKHFDLADNDFNSMRERIVLAIEKDKVKWFRFYGVPKRFWKAHYINFNQIKESDVEVKTQTGLEAWGL